VVHSVYSYLRPPTVIWAVYHRDSPLGKCHTFHPDWGSIFGTHIHFLRSKKKNRKINSESECVEPDQKFRIQASYREVLMDSGEPDKFCGNTPPSGQDRKPNGIKWKYRKGGKSIRSAGIMNPPYMKNRGSSNPRFDIYEENIFPRESLWQL
jgi:hypothetical protein